MLILKAAGVNFANSERSFSFPLRENPHCGVVLSRRERGGGGREEERKTFRCAFVCSCSDHLISKVLTCPSLRSGSSRAPCNSLSLSKSPHCTIIFCLLHTHTYLLWGCSLYYRVPLRSRSCPSMPKMQGCTSLRSTQSRSFSSGVGCIMSSFRSTGASWIWIVAGARTAVLLFVPTCTRACVRAS